MTTETIRQEVLIDVLMALISAYGIYFSDTQTQSAFFGFLCGGNLVFALSDYREYMERKSK